MYRHANNARIIISFAFLVLFCSVFLNAMENTKKTDDVSLDYTNIANAILTLDIPQNSSSQDNSIKNKMESSTPIFIYCSLGCGKKYKQVSAMKQHVKMRCKKNKNKEPVLYDDICKKKLSKKKLSKKIYLKNHVYEKVPMVYSCEFDCGKQFINEKEKNDHELEHVNSFFVDTND